MTTHSFQSGAASGTPADTVLGIRSVAELVAHTLRGLHRCNDHFVRMNATLGEDGYIAVELTRVSIGGEDATVRVLLHPTGPVPVTPHSLAGTGPGPSAA
ncbi:MAG: hypothetical protein ACRDRU_20280 [Pseudonocardiaceae bacterium]